MGNTSVEAESHLSFALTGRPWHGQKSVMPERPITRSELQLRTNTMKVKRLMSNGTLEWLNLRVNGAIYFSEAGILAWQRTLLEKKAGRAEL
jgi:hypothetical protein